MKSLSLSLLIIATASLTNCTQVVKIKEVVQQPVAKSFQKMSPTGVLEEQLELAESAFHHVQQDPSDPAAIQQYNQAVEQIFLTVKNAKLTPWDAPIQVGRRTLTGQKNSNPEWNPALYELTPSANLNISGSYVDQRSVKEGIGATLIAKRSADPLHDYAPTPHFHYAVTGLAQFDGSRCVLSLADPMHEERIRLGNRDFPLGADFTAPLALMLEEMEQEKLGLSRLLRPAKFASTARISRLEPYDPNKTVVILVHGLMSSPATWFPLLNHLQSKEDIRQKYQFWFYSYPSGYPYPYAAAIMRRELDEMKKQYPLKKKMVVVGHSMGGCISRLLITDSDRRIWNDLFDVSPEQMPLSEEHRHILTESIVFQHRAEVGRVIFISAPHQGSELATSWVGRFGARLVKMPINLIAFGKEQLTWQQYTKGSEHLHRIPNSVDTLSPKNQFVRALHQVPIKQGVPYHTIAGDRGLGDSPNSSDGVVPYWSSHLPQAVSEKIVPSHHPAHQNSAAIDEVHRILKMHGQ